MWRWLCAWIALLALTAGAAAAAPTTGQEGHWILAAGDTACYAKMRADGDVQFILVAEAGQVSMAVNTPTRMKRGKVGQFRADTVDFDFTPAYDRKDFLFILDPLGDRTLADLRQAKTVLVIVDHRMVMEAKVEGTGFAGALDSVIACSKGESGWWGKGVQVAGAQPAKPERALNKEGAWSLAADNRVCTALTQLDDGMGLVLISMNGGGDIAVGLGSDTGVKRGRKGLFETDAYSFSFKPVYEGKTYMQLPVFLDSQALFALRRAKWVRVSVDGDPQFDADFTDTGFPELLTSLAACGRGESGWWGAGAKAR